MRGALRPASHECAACYGAAPVADGNVVAAGPDGTAAFRQLRTPKAGAEVRLLFTIDGAPGVNATSQPLEVRPCAPATCMRRGTARAGRHCRSNGAGR